MQYCPHCGERVDPEDAYCFECGASLGGPHDDTGQDRTPERPPGPGRETGRPVEPGTRRRRDPDSRGQVESPGTLKIAVTVAVLACLETGARAALVFSDPDAVLEQAEAVGVAGEVSTGVLVATAGVGLTVAVALAAVCGYYYRQGYVDRRFFWTLVGASVVGFLFGGGLSFVLAAGVGAYGLLVVLRRQGSKEPQATSP